MVILHPLSFRGSESSDKRIETNYGHSAPFVIRGQWVEWWAEINYVHSAYLFRHPDTIVSDGTQRQIMVILRLLSSRGGEPDDMRRQIMVICAFRRLRGTNSAVSGWCWSFGADHFQNFCRFRWWGDWLAEWCSARTKLVSYLYFPFISNKRQVKRGNCHTLISSGDHLFVGVLPLLDHFELLDTHR